MSEERSVPVAEAARRLSLAPKTVRRMLARGELAGGRFGRLWRVDLAALERRRKASVVQEPER